MRVGPGAVLSAVGPQAAHFWGLDGELEKFWGLKMVSCCHFGWEQTLVLFMTPGFLHCPYTGASSCI